MRLDKGKAFPQGQERMLALEVAVRSSGLEPLLRPVLEVAP